MAPARESTVTRQDIARRNEALVLAENALNVERAVATLRLFNFTLIALTQSVGYRLITGVQQEAPAGMFWVIGIYALFAIGHWNGVRKATPNVDQAIYFPLMIAVVDISFSTAMGLVMMHSPSRDVLREVTILNALFICFSVGRFSDIQVPLSVGAAIASFLIVVGVADAWSFWGTNLFTVATFISIGVLIHYVRRRTSAMFVGVRKRDTLTRFLPSAVAERVIADGEEALAPAHREVTLMFTDIRDFTAQSEAMPPEAVLEFLDDYFGHMSQLVKAHDGMVNKFLGDGMLAVWGAPERMADHAERAVRCALDMRKVLTEINQVRAHAGAPALKIGIAVHSGPVAAGMLGGAEQHEYTVIGDAVNLTSRVESLTKLHGVDLLITDATWQVVADRFSGGRLVGASEIRGRKNPVLLHTIDPQGA
jgi:adenylate cyclase